MSLNFFKTTPKKTDATLKFSSVLNHLNETNDIIPLNIDQFIQQENIHLGQYQEFYKESTNTKNAVAPKSITKDDTRTQQEDTRLLVNSLIELSKSMPENKSQALESSDKIQITLLQNDHTINDINSINQFL